MKASSRWQQEQARLQQAIDSMPYLRWLGARIVELHRAKAAVELKVRDEMLQVAGLLHGGVIASMADVACAMAAMSALPDLREIRTIEMKINYFRSVRSGTIRVRARCDHLGRSTAVTSCIVRHMESRRKTAMGIVTFAIISNAGLTGKSTRIIQ